MSEQISLNDLPCAIMKYRVEQVEEKASKTENRLEKVEDAIIKYDTILWLTMGGGFLGLINFLTLIYFIVTK